MPPCRNLFDCERRIRGSDHEIACIFADEWTLLKGGITQGYIFGVGFTDEEFSLMRRGILTHNHTGPYTNSFSLGDVTKAVEADLREIRVAGQRFTFSMKPGAAGWPAPEAIRERYHAIENDCRFYLEFRIRFLEVGRREGVPEGDDARFFNHLIWERLSREMGLCYSREEWPG
ncbi:hypothetical protein FGU65_12925 [Methanoculleus sp. FWC-SCC1]|uniref:Uncharacterized protein n=1 Tax=Methanoculleus frigidifontis TaxID=2584085 RepID=A0ABT8MD04_9EURY|nr:hypothetical protein [Methanoculleus sp. FWC-SCC1]MDN7025771.1 hypothetical protein [Methanoculleus sp. FWC-SCC1]